MKVLVSGRDVLLCTVLKFAEGQTETFIEGNIRGPMAQPRTVYLRWPLQLDQSEHDLRKCPSSSVTKLMIQPELK
jgi:hypothetical protein